MSDKGPAPSPSRHGLDVKEDYGFRWFARGTPCPDDIDFSNPPMVLPSYADGAKPNAHTENYADCIVKNPKTGRYHCLFPVIDAKTGSPRACNCDMSYADGFGNFISHFVAKHLAACNAYTIFKELKNKTTAVSSGGGAASSSGGSSAGQTTLEKHFKKRTSETSIRDALTEAQARACTKMSISFNMMACDEMRELLTMAVNLGHEFGPITADKLASRQTITRKADDIMKTTLSEALAELHAAAEGLRVAITIDIGQASGMRSVLGLIAHIMSETGQIISVPVACQHFPGKHDAAAITEALLAVQAKANLHYRVHACVTDSGKNISKAVDDLDQVGLTAFACIAHTISLVMKYIEDIGGEKDDEKDTRKPPRIWPASSQLHNLFACSAKMRYALDVARKEMGEKPLRPRADVATRFCTKLLQAQRLNELLPAMKRINNCSGPNAKIYEEAVADAEALNSAVTEFEAAMLEIPRSFEFMESLAQWMTILSGRDTPTLPLVRPFWRYIRDYLNKYLDDELTPPLQPADKALLLHLDNAVDSYFFGLKPVFKIGRKVKGPPPPPEMKYNPKDDWTMNDVYRLAELFGVRGIVVDPKEPGWSTAEDIIDAIVRWYHALVVPAGTKAAEGPKAPARRGGAAAKASGGGGFMPAPLVNRVDPVRTEAIEFYDALYKAVAKHRLDPDPSKKPLHWYNDFWASRKTESPRVWKLARMILSTPASSVPVESLFSVMSSIDSKKRGSLGIERLCNLTMSNMLRMRSAKPATLPPMPDVAKPLRSLKDTVPEDFPSEKDIDDALRLDAVILSCEEEVEEGVIDLADGDEPPAKRRKVEDEGGAATAASQ